MEYTLKVTVAPAEKPDHFKAHLFVVADDDNVRVGATLIGTFDLGALWAHPESDARHWALYLVKMLGYKVEHDLYLGAGYETSFLMKDVFEHQEDLRCRL